MKILKYSWLLLSFVISSTPKDFAFGLQWEADTISPIIQIALPAEAYTLAESLQSTNKRVFDSNTKQERAFQWVSAKSPQNIDSSWTPLPFLKKDEKQSAQRLSAQFSLYATPTTLRISAKQKRKAKFQDWFIDLDNKNTLLKLHWNTQEDALSKVQLATSQDLIHWKTIAKSQTLAHIQQGQFKAKQHQIRTPQAKYLRLRLTPQKEPIFLTKVEALQLSSFSQTNSILSQAILQEQIADTLWLTTPGSPHIETWHIPLKANEWAKLRLEYSSHKEGPWRRSYSGTLYHLEQNESTLKETTISLLKAKRNLYWRFIFESKSFQKTPTVQFSWIPDSIKIATENSKQLTLAIGRHHKLPLQLAKTWPELPFKATTTEAAFQNVELGGEALLAAPQEIPQKLPYILWLIVFILALILLSFKVWKEYKKANS